MTSQKDLLEKMLPILLDHGKQYEKSSKVKARLAKPGERVASVTSDGLETENTAGDADYLVQNDTNAKELYLVKEDSFKKKYRFEKAADDGWDWYQSFGKIIAVEITIDLLQPFGWELPFYFEAAWKETMIVKEKDFLVCPAEDRNEIYRIARKEFFETYREIDDR